jgi:Clostripain family
MLDKKPWTMMVYLAADNNLFTFGVDSLRQMKAAAGDKINILAEFDTGPLNPAKRYVFDGLHTVGPIAQDLKKKFGPTNAADPDNLANFIAWGASNYPADHYFVVIWGHGGGVDDDFPRPDNTFVPRHALLSLFKGTGSDFPKGTGSDFPKGTGSDFPKGTGSDFPKGTGTTVDQAEADLDAHWRDLLKAPLKKISDIFTFGDDALRDAVVRALRDGLSHALGEQVLNGIRKLDTVGEHKPFNRNQTARLDKLRIKILALLTEAASGKLQNGTLGALRRGLVTAMERGVLDALKAGTLYELQTAVIGALQEKDTAAAVEKIRGAALNAILHFLENGILEVQRSGIISTLENQMASPKKSLAFVDHPESFLTNKGLKKALRLATELIGQKIDILGLDSCNMGMVEIGYELRESVNLLVASQDDIPDASWPYDRIIHRLVSESSMSPNKLAAEVITTYIDAYRDYSKKDITAPELATLDDPVTLSVLDLELCQIVVPGLSDLVQAMRNALRTSAGQQIIFDARELVEKFGQNQFIDFIRFCEGLTNTSDDPRKARRADSGVEVIPEVQHLTEVANRLIGDIRSIVTKKEFSRGDEDCSGTSVYLPQFDLEAAQKGHQKRLGVLYNELDFAKVTGWGTFVTEFLNRQQKQLAVTSVLVQPGAKTRKASKKLVAKLQSVKKASTATSKQLTEILRMPESAVTVNGALDSVAQAADVVTAKIESVLATTKNGHQNGRSHTQDQQPE